jgi:hypothetical protein
MNCRECEEPVSAARSALGYTRCVECAIDLERRAPVPICSPKPTLKPRAVNYRAEAVARRLRLQHELDVAEIESAVLLDQ